MEKQENAQRTFVALLSNEFKLNFEIDDYKSFDLVLKGSDDTGNVDMLTMTFRHFELNFSARSFGNSHKIPYATGDSIELQCNSDLLQVNINGQKVFTTVAAKGTPEKIIYKTEIRGIPPQINLIK